MKRTEYSAQELRERTDKELRSAERQIQNDLFKLRLERATNQLENVAQVKTAKRNLARVKTLITARAKGIESSKPDYREE
jgi:large subunit ribosomal protein L29